MGGVLLAILSTLSRKISEEGPCVFFLRGVQYLNLSKQPESTVWNRFSFPISEISF